MEPKGTALVTGASRGIGRATALELARRGFDVVATMRDPSAGSALADELGAAAGTLRVERMDVNDGDAVSVPDSLRVLVNNAGVEDDNLPVEIAPDELWRRMFETNVFGLVNVTRAAIPVLRANGGGVIANVTSSSILAPVPFLGVYRASKAAVSALGESLQAEVARFGIRVVEIMPGPIETDMLAASDRPAAAIDHEPYRELAESMWQSRRAIRDQYTPAAVAATRIADAVLDGDGPLRYGCDDMSQGMLDAWRSVPGDEAWLRPMFQAFS
jgi:NAD(P)-dependent dehydrogenase (short-subunit alcohol dehydrogenase family)